MQALLAAAVGGTASKITGGKFANGAVTAAMAHVLNQEKAAQKAREHYMKHGVYPRVNGKRQSPSTWDKLMRGLKVMRGVDVSGEAHQFLKENPDLTNGAQLTVSAAGVPFRAISYLDTGSDAAGIVHDVAAGNYVEALIGTELIKTGKTQRLLVAVAQTYQP